MTVNKRTPTRLMKSGLNSAGSHHCGALISAGDVDKTSSWSFDADDGNKLLGADGKDWTAYAQWFLGEDTTAPEGTKARYKYPFGKDGKVFRSALIAIRSRASQQDDTPVFNAAGHFIDEIDGSKNYTAQKALPMVMRSWAKLTLKAVDEDQRIITGIASTPSSDRMNDVVEPMGAKFDLPLPFLWQHDSEQPVGEVTNAKPTKDGIPVTIKMASIDEPGTLKDRLDEAWQSIKIGLVKGLSIGFAPIEYAFQDDGGIHFTEWEWLELSGVTIPANADCSITTIKSFDEAAEKIREKNKSRVSIKLTEGDLKVNHRSKHVLGLVDQFQTKCVNSLVREDFIESK